MKKKFFFYFILLYLTACAAAAGISHLVYQLALREETVEFEAGERIYIAGRNAMLGHLFESIFSDLLFLSDQTLLKSFLSNGNPETKRLLRDEYCAFARRKKKYDQVRLLDLSGREIIRVNCQGNRSEIVPEEALQNKSSRYYFIKTLESDGVYVSHMDLNVEHQVIEIPHKPVMRFGLTVRDLKGTKKGVLVLNYLGNHLFHMITHGDEPSAGNLMIVNRDGYWLLGPVKDDLWGFMIPERTQCTFNEKYPGAWANISEISSGQIHGTGGIFTWDTVHIGIQKELSWKLVSNVPEQRILEELESFKEKLTLYNGVIMLLLAIPVFLFTCMGYKRKHLQEALFRSANYDALTGLANRALFYTILNQTIAHAGRYNEKFAVLFIDIDGFKQVNDSLGHDAGDVLLSQAAGRLTACIRASDFAARLGGDEFVVILRKIAKPLDVKTVAQKIIDSFSSPFSLSPHTATVGASIGISFYPESGTSPELLVKTADSQMYRSKRQGKNTYSLCPSGDGEAT